MDVVFNNGQLLAATRYQNEVVDHYTVSYVNVLRPDKSNPLPNGTVLSYMLELTHRFTSLQKYSIIVGFLCQSATQTARHLTEACLLQRSSPGIAPTGCSTSPSL
jgi:hypothetical protein